MSTSPSASKTLANSPASARDERYKVLCDTPTDALYAPSRADRSTSTALWTR
jgi:hypothetical protein